MKADVAGDVTQKEFRSFCYEDIQCYCILQFSEYCAILGVLCAHDYKKKTIGFFSMLNFAVEAQFKM